MENSNMFIFWFYCKYYFVFFYIIKEDSFVMMICSLVFIEINQEGEFIFIKFIIYMNCSCVCCLNIIIFNVIRKIIFFFRDKGYNLIDYILQ